MQIKKEILEILHTKTFGQSILTISATLMSGVLGLIFYMVVARNLGPANFGIFAVATATLALIADIGDLGTDTGLIRFIGKYISRKDKALKFLKLGFEVKVLVWLLVLSLGWLFSPIIAINLLQKEELINPLRLAFIGVGGALLISFSAHAIQAYQKYKIWSLTIVSSNLFRLILVFLIIFVVGGNIDNLLLVYILVPFIFFIISLFFIPAFFGVKKEFAVASEFFKFNRWIFLISVIAAISSRADTFLVTRLLPLKEVGIYSAALQLTSFIPQLFFAIATVAAPKLASSHSRLETIKYLKKLQLLVVGLTMLGLFGLPVGYFIISRLYGYLYLESFSPFVILYISQLIFLLALPTHQVIFYYLAKPLIFVPIALVQLLIVIILGWYLIISFGIIGAAIAVFLGNLVLLLAPAIWVIYQLRKTT